MSRDLIDEIKWRIEHPDTEDKYRLALLGLLQEGLKVRTDENFDAIKWFEKARAMINEKE